ncbi:hypothetical protein M405DRAFT_846184 [Rhizopogon salebrosus TDB-379]|nr:hypothetical protein M405DRAFT_846184 [Rhizopogon salebrosus TDB-379]
MPENSNNFAPSFDNQQRELLEHRFPRAGYWFNMLPTHPFIHGINASASQPTASQLRVPRGLNDLVPLPGTHNTDGQSQSSTLIPALTQQVPTHANITVSVPLNTGTAGANVSRVQMRLPLDITFEDFFSRVCAKMDLDPSGAQLGYKFSTDRVRDDPNQLSSELQLREAMERGERLLNRARTREIILEIHNLRKTHQAASASRRSREEAGLESQDPPTSVTFAAEFRELKNRLDCAKHSGKYCYINPISGEHEAQDVFKLTLWAKKISLSEATYDRPPEAAMFDHARKKRRTSSTLQASPRTEASGSNVPAIHVHIPPMRGQPLGDVHGRHEVNTSTVLSLLSPSLLGQQCDDDDNDETITYPPIIDVLEGMDVTMPLLNMPQYEAVLIEHGIAYVNNAVGIPHHWFVDVIGMPLGVMRSFFDVTRRFIQRARKGKARAVRNRYDPDGDKENYEPRQQSAEV